MDARRNRTKDDRLIRAPASNQAWPDIVLTVGGLQLMIDLLRAGGRTVIGPTVRDGAVVHAEIRTVDELPRGVGDEQDAAHYRLRARPDEALFGYTVSADSWKRLFLRPRELVLRSDGAPEPVDDAPPGPYALLGVRSCDLHALRLHDGILMGRGAVDVRYARRREGTFVVAVSCTEPGGTCFCSDLGTGPEPDAGFDVRLTELLPGDGDDGGHRFLGTAGSAAGAELLAALPAVPATEADLAVADGAVRAAAGRTGRRLPLDGLRETLYAAAEHPHWQEVAGRCLACANCTMVCPTCFCTSVEDSTDLTGTVRERRRVWDSCFTSDFSHLHGGSVRESTAARYRQWLTHKLAAWIDQFGSPGCVGCGRCVTWCPAGIDLTAEVAALRDKSPAPAAGSQG